MCTVEALGNISGPTKASRWIIDDAKEHIRHLHGTTKEIATSHPIQY